MLVGVLEVARITAPESILSLLYDYDERASASDLFHHGVNLIFGNDVVAD